MKVKELKKLSLTCILIMVLGCNQDKFQEIESMLITYYGALQIKDWVYVDLCG